MNDDPTNLLETPADDATRGPHDTPAGPAAPANPLANPLAEQVYQQLKSDIFSFPILYMVGQRDFQFSDATRKRLLGLTALRPFVVQSVGRVETKPRLGMSARVAVDGPTATIELDSFAEPPQPEGAKEVTFCPMN